MMVMAAPCAVAAIVIGLFVSDGGTARFAGTMRAAPLPVLYQPAAT